MFTVSSPYATNTDSGVIRIATSAELTAGTSTSVAITPALLETRLGGLTIVSADTTQEGLIEIATNAEVAAGTDSDTAVTPASLRYALDQSDYLLDGGAY